MVFNLKGRKISDKKEDAGEFFWYFDNNVGKALNWPAVFPIQVYDISSKMGGSS